MLLAASGCGGSAAPSPSSGPASAKAPPPASSASAEPLLPGPPLAGCPPEIRATADGVAVSRPLIDAILKEPWRAGAAASLDTGGVKLGRLTPFGAVSCLGLKDGDILATVAGVPLSSPLSALDILPPRVAYLRRISVLFWRDMRLRRLAITLE
jgi:hypothetical protein